MLDIKLIRQDPKLMEEKLKTKVPGTDIFKIISIDDEIRKIQTKTDELKNTRNIASKTIGQKKSKGEDVSIILSEMTTISNEISILDKQFKELESQRGYLLSTLPNLPDDNIPVSLNVEDNKCIKTFKEKTKFDFPFKNHLELNEKLDLFDFNAATKISGARFPLYKNLGARLEWALINYMIETHIKNGFMQIIPPLLVKESTMYGCAQLPKFKDQLFHLSDSDFDLYIIPTAEASLSGIHSDEIIDEKSLPFKYVSYTPCFRREAGSHGKQERGLIRTHQFNKVELFAYTAPNDSDRVFEEILSSAEKVLQGLNLHYKNMLLCTGDMSFASAKTIDIEVYLPGQNRYYEVSSVSNCRDFQTRRSHTRCRGEDEKIKLVHTLNGSGLATSRLMVAILENNQKEDGSVVIPEVLQKYMDGIEALKPIN